MTATEKNEMYGKLNKRSERRFAILRNLGFTYVRLDEYNMAIWTKKIPTSKFPLSFGSGEVMKAPSTLWDDMLERATAFN